MTILDSDFRFLDSSLTLYLIEEHVENIESHITELEREAEAFYKDQISGDPDRASREDAMRTWQERIGIEIPWLIRNPLITTLYGSVETMIRDAEVIIKKRLASNSFSFPEKNFLENARSLLKTEANIDLCDEPTFQNLKELCLLRNALVHSHGRKDLLKSDQKKLVNRLCREGAISDHQTVVISREYLEKVSKETIEFLRAFMEKVKEWDDCGKR